MKSFFSKLSVFFCLFTASFAAEKTCDGQLITPFSSSILGKSYFRSDDCYRPSASSSITVYKKSLVFQPFFGDPSYACYPRQQLVYKQYPRHPFIIDTPKAGLLVNDADCTKLQMKVRKVLFPWGKTRPAFEMALKSMIEELAKISAFECGTENGFVIIKPGRNFKNVDVEQIIGYLRSIAYQYNICL